MKRLSFLFIAAALVGFISLNACKSGATKPEAEETIVDEEIPAADVPAEVETPADTTTMQVVADTTAMETAPAAE